MKESPFKFLDSFTKQDQELFFGRDDEIELLYQKIFKSKLMLVYGASGVGKTSLIQCGLASKFSDENWFSISIRRQNNINDSIFKALNTNSITKIDKYDLENDRSEIVQRLEGLYFDHFKPIYLIFDQLEELFILGNEEEQQQFYTNIYNIINSNLSCTILLIIREEYIAFLSGMEDLISNLFDNRMRIEKMRKRKINDVVKKSCQKIKNIQIKKENLFLNKLTNNLTEDGLTVELTYLQVYLDKLYKNAIQKNNVYIFDIELLKNTGKFDDVLAEFLEEQVQYLPDTELGWKLLKLFITKEGTKKSTSIVDVQAIFQKQNLPYTLNDIEVSINFFVHSKILTEAENSTDSYEFSHDSLAKKTFQKLDARERNIHEVETLVEQQHKSYLKRKVLLNKETLLYIKPYLKDLHLSKGQQDFINKSEKEIYLKRKRKRASIILVILGLTFISILSIVKTYEAKEKEQKAKNALERYEQEEKKKRNLEINAVLDGIKTLLNANNDKYTKDAIHLLDSISKFDNSLENINRIEEYREKIKQRSY